MTIDLNNKSINRSLIINDNIESITPKDKFLNRKNAWMSSLSVGGVGYHDQESSFYGVKNYRTMNEWTESNVEDSY